MIDYFAIGLTHGLLVLAVWRLLQRGDLDNDIDTAPKVVKPWLKGRKAPQRHVSKQAGDDA